MSKGVQAKPRTLSVRQPWAWAILHAGKDIENRFWSTRCRQAGGGCARDLDADDDDGNYEDEEEEEEEGEEVMLV